MVLPSVTDSVANQGDCRQYAGGAARAGTAPESDQRRSARGERPPARAWRMLAASQGEADRAHSLLSLLGTDQAVLGAD